jgi:hypothetical protein
MLSFIGKKKKQFEAAKRSAEAGDEDVYYELGEMYCSGYGVNVDYLEAFRWWKVCRDKNSPGAASAHKRIIDLVGKRLPEDKWLGANRPFILEAVGEWAQALMYASEGLRSDREIVLKAFKEAKNAPDIDGLLQYVSQELRADREIVLVAVQQDGANLKYVPDILNTDREIVVTALKHRGDAIEYASPELRREILADPALISEILLAGGYELLGLPDLPTDISDDKGTVLAAISVSGNALYYASERLRADKEVVLAAIEQWPDSMDILGCVSSDLLSDGDVILAAVEKYGSDIIPEYAAEELLTDVEFVTKLALEEPDVFEEHQPHISAELQESLFSDRQTVLRMKGILLRHVTPELQSDHEVVLAAVQEKGENLQYASEELRADREIVLAAIKSGTYVLMHAADSLKSDREIVLAAAQRIGPELQYASEELRADREIVLAAVQAQEQLFYSGLKYASEELRADREIVLAAVQRSGEALKYASEELRNDPKLIAIKDASD